MINTIQPIHTEELSKKERLIKYNKKYREANKDKIKARQKSYIEANKNRIRTYNKANKDKLKDYSKAYTKANKDKLKDYSKGYREANKDKIKAQLKAYREANMDKLKAYREANKDKMKVYHNVNKGKLKTYREVNKDKIKTQLKTYREVNRANINAHQIKRRKEDVMFKLKCTLRSHSSRAFKRIGLSKPTKTEHLLGCSWEEAKTHIESLFHEGMSWDNYGKWHIDHIIPIASATTLDEAIKLNYISNLQPLWAKDNLSKGSKL
jgi:hypothetical protein